MRTALPYIEPVVGKVVPRSPGMVTVDGEPERIIHFRGEPDLPRWEGRCKVRFDAVRPFAPAYELEAIWLAEHMAAGYSGDHVRLSDYYVREIERIGTEHRQVVRFEVVGTGRVESMPRSRFDRQARAA